jgi:hypothetical protein
MRHRDIKTTNKHCPDLILSYGDVAIEDVLQVLAGWSG